MALSPNTFDKIETAFSNHWNRFQNPTSDIAKSLENPEALFPHLLEKSSDLFDNLLLITLTQANATGKAQGPLYQVTGVAI